MKSKDSSTNNDISWASSVMELAGKSKPSQSLTKLYKGGIKSISDLIWILPLRVQKAPNISSFSTMEIDKLFIGSATLIDIRFTPNYSRKGKNSAQLFNATAVVKDEYSNNYLNLKWFNTYSSLKKQIESLRTFTFMGKVSDYKGTLQITNPKINPKEISTPGKLIIEYPTVHSVPGRYILSIISKIPISLWERPLYILPSSLASSLKIQPLNKAFKVLHGLESSGDIQVAKDEIIYQEFFYSYMKVLARRFRNKQIPSQKVTIESSKVSTFKKLFPYDLTIDQSTVLDEIISDFSSQRPMMRLLQGDVGCGKTTVALISALIIIENGSQVAIMCPTETLARQHFDSFSEILPKNINMLLLTGSTPLKEKAVINEQLLTGSADLVIGTHTLFQNNIQFSDLKLAIIDEQHKFGVDQRQKLINKGTTTHSLIMSATPIPRSLQLSQFGDLDISTIRSMPKGRKGVKTRIVTEQTYEKYLSFIKTRISIGEQIYIVVPAIEESETLAIENVNSLSQTYKKYFPEFKVAVMHGGLNAKEKSEIMKKFSDNKIQILISTTVIEVGINILNSTVMSIYNPERFGLSSIHQLRGRVGRGEKPGFCFLISHKDMSSDALARIKIIEKSHDGFEIAQADLVNRGQGDLFGAEQSGYKTHYKLANPILHYKVFEKVTQDIEKLQLSHTEDVNNYLLELLEDSKISSTI